MAEQKTASLNELFGQTQKKGSLDDLFGSAQLNVVESESSFNALLEENQKEMAAKEEPLVIEVDTDMGYDGSAEAGSYVSTGDEEYVYEIDSPDLIKKEAELMMATQPNVPDGEGVCDSENITYMSYKKIMARNSIQWKLQHDEHCFTDPRTGIRLVDDRYCIAVGSGYAKNAGEKVNVVFEDGTVLRGILGDCKADKHTDPATHRYQKYDGLVLEFVIDPEVFRSTSQWSRVIGKGKIVKVVNVTRLTAH
jgi:hypothetical protein